MEADDVLIGKNKTSTIEDALFSSIGKQITKDIIDDGFKKKQGLIEMNPKPFIRIVDVKGRDRKFHRGIEVGIDFSF